MNEKIGRFVSLHKPIYVPYIYLVYLNIAG